MSVNLILCNALNFLIIVKKLRVLLCFLIGFLFIERYIKIPNLYINKLTLIVKNHTD